MRVKCLAQEHNTMTRPGLEPGPLDLGSSPLTTRPPCLPQNVKMLTLISINYLSQILTALACAILRTGFSPSFLIFLITGTYDIGITSTGIPFLN